MQIGVIGSGECSSKIKILAQEVGREIARRGATLVCGGLGGVMEAAAKGAKQAGGLTVGILPGLNAGEANPYIDVVVATGMSYARNVIVVRSSDALIAIEGKYGTLSEIAFALQLHKPIVGLNTWKVSKEIISLSSPVEAVEKVIGLAKGRKG
jgi:uncharacterized protein (TIGR00725 family)